MPLVGGKNASIGELYREVQSAGVRAVVNEHAVDELEEGLYLL